MMRSVFYFLLLAGAMASTSAAQQPSCPLNDWCQIYNQKSFVNYGYNSPRFSEALGATVLASSNRLSPNTIVNGPEATGFSYYVTQSAPVTSNPWRSISDCACDAKTEIREMMFVLAANVGPSDTSLLLKVGTAGDKAINAPNTFPQTGMVYIQDEAVSYGGCDTILPSFIANSCTTGATEIRLNNLKRGLWQANGFLPAIAHSGGKGGRGGAGEEVNLLCPSGPHPPAMHTVNYPTLEGSKLTFEIGFQERWTNASRWTYQLPNGPWMYTPVFSMGGVFPLNYQEGSRVYDPETDSEVEYGGLHDGPTADQYVKCLSSPTKAYGCNGVINRWIKVTPHDGTPGKRDGVRGDYDPSNHKLVWMGGATQGTSAGFTNTVAWYDNVTGDWCVSDPSKGVGSNAHSCSQPTMTGTPPPDGMIPNKWAAWTYNPHRAQWTFTDNLHVWLFNLATNSWTLSKAGPSPCPQPPANSWNGRGWAYDDLNRTYVLVEHTGYLCQLPDAALGQ